MKTLQVGIASYAKMKARTLEIARGERKVKDDEPKVWFTSVESFAKVLSDRNRALLELIRAHHPESLAELAALSGREKSNLSRTLKTMAHYGLVSLKEGPPGQRYSSRAVFSNRTQSEPGPGTMTSAFSKPILVPPAGPAVVLERLPLTGPASGEYSEQWLQNLLYQFPQALPIAEINDAFSELIPVCREMNTPAGPIDVVYITPTGRPVIVEAKLWRNPEARRKVVGQILDYAKELSHWNYETFDAAVRSSRRVEDRTQDPKGLLELVRQTNPEIDEARFFDSVTQSLRRGDLLLVIVGDGIREGVGAITQFLEGHGTLHFTFGLVEMAIYRMPSGTLLVQPRVLIQSTIARRIVVQVDGTGLAMQEDPAAEEESGDPVSQELAQTRSHYSQFWTEFLQKLELDDKSQPISNPGKSTNQFFAMPKGSNAWVSAYLAQASQRIGVYLTFAKGPIGNRLYERLKEESEAIERALAVPVSWESDGAKHWIITRASFPGQLIEAHRQEALAWFSDRVNRFVTVFRPRIDALVKESELA